MSKVITFYSFKGGVGRTMAMANVGFLAALNGKRVLLIDWDLEAPGLEYYFRGLSDRNAEASFKDAPGILNILVEWSQQVRPEISIEEINGLCEPYVEGSKFRECVRSLVEPTLRNDLFGENSALDIIGAGSRVFEDEKRSYESVLSEFSWSKFFSDHAGGYLLQSLQSWAKLNYDIVLIDSRTGLADAAGICTMLLPDTVALCFALNHQNIEGVARVASSVSAVGQGSIRIRPVPMRVARRDSSEGSDAQARALAALVNTGGLNIDETKEDLQTLSVAFEDGVPYYETLAPFIAPDPAIDPLCVAYVRLAKALVGPDVVMPPIARGTIARVKARLSPRNATAEYVSELAGAETERAFSELQRLVEMAYNSALETELIDKDYVRALFETTLDVVNRVDDLDEGLALLLQAVDVIKVLAQRRPSEWGLIYRATVSEAVDVTSLYGDTEKEVQLRRDLDKFLHQSSNIDDQLMRLRNLNELARTLMALPDINEVARILKIAAEIVERLDSAAMTPIQLRTLMASLARIALLSGDASATTGNYDEASDYYQKGLVTIEGLAPTKEDADLLRIKFSLHLALAMLPHISAELVGHHAIAAASMNMPEFAMRFSSVARKILEVHSDQEIIAEFCRRSFNPAMRRRIIAQYARNGLRVVELLEILRDFSKSIDCLSEALGSDIIQTLAYAYTEALQAIGKARYRLGLSNMLRAVKLTEEFISRIQRLECVESSILEALQNSFIEFKQRNPD